MEPTSTAETWYDIAVKYENCNVSSLKTRSFQLKMTPLHWAVEREHVEVMHILLDHGADTNATSKFDKTPISLALEHDRLDLVDILQQEREIIGIQAQQQSQANSAELEVATHNLIQLEAEDNSKNSIALDMEQQKFPMLQQSQQRKRKLSQCVYFVIVCICIFSDQAQHCSSRTHVLSFPAQMEKKQKLIFQQIPVSSNELDDQQAKEMEGVEVIDTNNKNRKHKDMMSLGGIGKQFRLLEAHGITMIPVDDESSIVENAVESGRTVVLTGLFLFFFFFLFFFSTHLYIECTLFILERKLSLRVSIAEAGKLALNLTKGTPIKRLQVASRKGTARKVIAIRTDQIQSKILNQNASTVTSRGPNILKRSAADNKTAKLFLTTIPNTTTVSNITEMKTAVQSKEVNGCVCEYIYAYLVILYGQAMEYYGIVFS